MTAITIKRAWAERRAVNNLAASLGFYSDASVLHKFGANGDIGTSFETVWDVGGLYSYLSTASIIKISSSDADDTALGTGARTVQVYGQDSNYVEINETVTLNGQTAVNTVNSYLRVYRMIVRTAGSNDANLGDLYAGTGTVTAGVPANKYAKILIGNNQTLMSVYTIPAGKTGYLVSLQLSTNKDKETTVHYVERDLGQVFHLHWHMLLYQSSVDFLMPVMDTIPEKTDIEVRAKVSAVTADVSAHYGLLLVAN